VANAKKAEAAAASLLARAGITAPPVDVERVAHAQNIKVEYRQLETEISGCLVRREDGAVLMAINRQHHPNRQRFTAAHELGHFCLHGNEPSLFVDNMMVHFRADSAHGDRREYEANAFAAALLMPESMLRADLAKSPLDPFDDESVSRLAKRYQVSSQALTIRLMQTGLVEGIDGNRMGPRGASRRGK
jgi:Zn-dependent peptidase ImmA (M78 family)